MILNAFEGCLIFEALNYKLCDLECFYYKIVFIKSLNFYSGNFFKIEMNDLVIGIPN